MAEDSSNPLNPYSYLAGIVSFGPRNCGTAGFPGVYTVTIIILVAVTLIVFIENLFLIQ